jgi:hypothetical protein
LSISHFQIFLDAFTVLEKQSRLLGGDQVLCPPSENFGYQCTPLNAITFAYTGVDGVHYAILRVDDQVCDDSPVLFVSPMDSDDVTIIAESFLAYLAIGCGVSERKMQEIFDAERSIGHQLTAFLSSHFNHHRLLDDARIHQLTTRYKNSIERKNDSTRQPQYL